MIDFYRIKIYFVLVPFKAHHGPDEDAKPLPQSTLKLNEPRKSKGHEDRR